MRGRRGTGGELGVGRWVRSAGRSGVGWVRGLAAMWPRGCGWGKVIKRMSNDPELKHVKLIAEPWDCSWPDGYLVGRFPSCGAPRWAEWNGKFRDAVRSFIKGDEGMKVVHACTLGQRPRTRHKLRLGK